MKTPGVKYCTSVVGFSMLSGCPTPTAPSSSSRWRSGLQRKKPRSNTQAIKTHLNRELGNVHRGHRLCLPAAGHPRRRHLGRRHLHPRGPGRQGHCVPGRADQQIPRGGPQAAGAGRHQHDLPPDGAPGLRGRGPRQGPQAGGGPLGCLQDPAVLHGRRLRELLQPLRPPVADLRPGRGRVPDQGRRTSGSSTCGTATARWCRSRP